MTIVRLPFRVLACLLRPPWGMMLLLTGAILFSVIVFGQKYWDEFQSQSKLLFLEKSKNNHKVALTQQVKQWGDAEYQPPLADVVEPRNEPHKDRVVGINVPYLVAESTHTELNNRWQQLTEQGNQNRNSPATELPDENFTVAKNQTSEPQQPATNPRVGFYSLQTPMPAPARNDQVLVARDLPRVSPFLSERLQRVAVRDLPKLPTQDLMRLLHHTNWEIAQQADVVLQKRDGFQNEHIQLARKLYHPDVAVRKSILPQLAEDEELETTSWLSELLKDPDQDVRLATGKAIYGQIPLTHTEREHLQMIMQSDSDQRVAVLGHGMGTVIR